MINENGTQRHTMNRQDLQYTYKKLDDFRADLTYSEYLLHKPAFDEIFALIHKCIRNSKRK